LYRYQPIILLTLAIILLNGCERSDGISQYPIPKPESIQLPAADLADQTSPPTAGRRERMLGAILPHGEQTWFFKLSGKPDRVTDRSEPFRDFVQSVRFHKDGTPQWTLPAGWTQQPGARMRFATIVVDAEEPPLELTVIALPSAAGDPVEQVLINVNRWRGQLSLPPIESAELSDESETVTLDSGLTATVVDYVGTTKPGGMTPPFAAGRGLNRPFGPASSATASSNEVAFTAKTPAGWSAGKVDGMRKAAFVIEDGDQKAEVTVIDLAREAGDRRANVNRWRGQVGSEPVDESQLRQSLKPIDVGGQSGDFVELAGSTGQSILGVIVDRGEKTWFFKLQGDTTVATAQKSNFETYVRSVKWK
jgi:hypothetical protein